MKINALKTSCMFYFYIDKHILCTNKLGYVVRMVVDSLLPHAERRTPVHDELSNLHSPIYDPGESAMFSTLNYTLSIEWQNISL